jgi:polar amino acid transport system permease protein
VTDGTIPAELGPQPISARHDWRYVLALSGALLLIVSYFLPMFANRITSATIRFSGGTVIEQQYPVLVHGEFYAQAARPLKEELSAVEITVAPVDDHATSGWGWVLAATRDGETLSTLLSYLLSLLVPVLGAVSVLAFAGLSLRRGARAYTGLIPITTNLAGAALLALALVWFHQYDFNDTLLPMTGGALAPRVGYWGAVLGALAQFVALAAMARLTMRKITSWWLLVFIVALSIWLLARFQPYPYLEIWNFVTDGILVTLRIVVTSFGFILLVSLLGGLGRISRSKIIYGIASLYVELIRGIPLLVQMLFIWYALPQVFESIGTILQAASPGLMAAGQWFLDLRLSAFTAAVVGLTICYGAYGSEIFRAGISSIHHGQMEAARSLGMTYVQAMRYVVLPQAVRVILPPIGNEFVALLKDSSLVSVLAVADLTRRGREYMARTFMIFDTWILVALCYLVMTLFSSRAVEFIESKTRFER